MNYKDTIRPSPLILVVDLEEGAAIFDGELGDDRNRPKHLTVTGDVMAADLGQDAPGLEASVYCLVTRVDTGLLLLVGDGVAGCRGCRGNLSCRRRRRSRCRLRHARRAQGSDIRSC
jgi:hypothetical protein